VTNALAFDARGDGFAFQRWRYLIFIIIAIMIPWQVESGVKSIDFGKLNDGKLPVTWSEHTTLLVSYC